MCVFRCKHNLAVGNGSRDRTPLPTVLPSLGCMFHRWRGNYFSCATYFLNHFSTTGRCSGPAHCDVSIRQAARAAFVTSSFKIFLTQTFPPCGATCYIVPSRAMTQLFNGVNCVYRSVEVYLTFCSYLRVLVRIRNFYNGGRY